MFIWVNHNQIVTGKKFNINFLNYQNFVKKNHKTPSGILTILLSALSTATWWQTQTLSQLYLLSQFLSYSIDYKEYITYDKFRCEIISMKRCPTENSIHRKFSMTWFQWIFGELLKFHRNLYHRKYYHQNLWHRN